MKNVKMKAVKLEIYNNRNNYKDIEWFFYDYEIEKEEWILQKKNEESQWNFHTPGAVSTRQYLFEEYDLNDILEMNITDSELTVKDLITIFKHFS